MPEGGTPGVVSDWYWREREKLKKEKKMMMGE